jgi:hypothetical protein
MVLAVAFVLALVQIAAAQNEGPQRRGRGFPLSSVRLATAEEVQTELKLSDGQKTKVAEINDKLRADVQQAFQSGGGFEQIPKLSEEASSKLAEVLDEGQRKRLMGITVQVNGPGALSEPAIVSELKLSAEQKTKLAEIRRAGFDAFRNAFQEMSGQGLSRDEMRAKFDELRADTEKKLLAELTSEQQAQLESLKGEPLEIDVSQFRGPGGGGQREQRSGEDEQQRDTESDTGESSAEEPVSSGN